MITMVPLNLVRNQFCLHSIIMSGVKAIASPEIVCVSHITIVFASPVWCKE